MNTDIARGQYYIARIDPDRIVLVIHAGITTVTTARVRADGYRRKGARRYLPMVRTVFERTFTLYRPCRWAFDCNTQAIGVIHHTDLGDYDACPEHLAEHTEWATDCQTKPRGQWREEPAPYCFCPDFVEREEMPYCPMHGTPEERGHDFGASFKYNLAAFAAEQPALELSQRLQDPAFRAAAVQAGYIAGTTVDAAELLDAADRILAGGGQ